MPDSINNLGRKDLQRVRRPFLVALSAIVCLVAADGLINYLFAYPTDPKVTNPSAVQLYFEYGRSAEGQLARIVRPDKSQTAPITMAGWYEPAEAACWTCRDESGTRLVSKPETSVVSIYGFSHALRLGYALGRVTDRYTTRIFSAPAAGSNWAYGEYLRDRGGGNSRAVVLAFSSSTLQWITAMSPMNFVFDHPLPYTADRFYLEGNDLRVIHPPYASFDQYVDTFYDPDKWSVARDYFAKNDEQYSAFMLRTNILDHSALFRLVRRAVGQQIWMRKSADVRDNGAFKRDSEQVRLAEAIIREFAMNARSDGMLPIIYVVNNLGYSDSLFKALRPVLEADHIPYLSSHTIVSPTDPKGYLPDTHFTDANDDKLANALANIIGSSSEPVSHTNQL